MRYLLAAALLAGCAAPRLYPVRAAVWRDPDGHPFAAKPEERYSGLAWDGADQMVFRPAARFWVVDPGRESVNVNALDEVPDSSWFENRIGTHPLPPDVVAAGPCRIPPPDPAGTWTITSGKPGGDNPGFVARGPDGQRYVVKLDSKGHVRATAADVLVSKLYWAAGYHVPCNRIVVLDRALLAIRPDAHYENQVGSKLAFTSAELDDIVAHAVRMPDGRYRAMASLFLEGEPLGPFRYEGTRGDDPNDVVPHQDRRELRGQKLLAAWTGHTDAREANSLDTWLAAKRGGWVRHNLLDFGDSLGSVWDPPMLGRRLGHSAYFDGVDVLSDWLTFGAVRRPWEDLRFGPSGRVFGYYDVSSFEPDRWAPGYPNPAMLRMTERDAAWMARILARLGRPHLTAIVAEAALGDASLEEELLRVLEGRRRRILARYLTRLSPLAWAEVRVRGGGGEEERAELCLEDLASSSGLIDARLCRYRARGWRKGGEELGLGAVRAEADGHVCVTLPIKPPWRRGELGYAIVDVSASPESEAPVRVHVASFGGADWRVVALERPPDGDPPAL